MTETHATTPPAAPVFPPGRYGRRREPAVRPRWAIALAVAAVVLAGSAVAVRLYQRYGDPAYQAEVVGYTDITDSRIVITFQVHLPDGRGAVCAVRARARDGSVVGRADVQVPPGSPRVSHELPTTARPFVGEVVRCRPAPAGAARA